MATKRIYKIVFLNRGKLYEIYARQVSQGELYGFVEVEGLVFGETSSVVVDPSEERLRSEFAGVKRTYIPMHAVVRIDQVEKQGTAKIVAVKDKGENVTALPTPLYAPSLEPDKP